MPFGGRLNDKKVKKEWQENVKGEPGTHLVQFSFPDKKYIDTGPTYLHFIAMHGLRMCAKHKREERRIQNRDNDVEQNVFGWPIELIAEVKNFFASLPTQPCYQYSCKKSIGPMDYHSLQAKREVWQVHRQCY